MGVSKECNLYQVLQGECERKKGKKAAMLECKQKLYSIMCTLAELLKNVTTLNAMVNTSLDFKTPGPFPHVYTQ